MEPDTDFVFYSEQDENGLNPNIISGGFSVNSILKNTRIQSAGGLKKDISNCENVSELFENLVVPSWLYSRNTLNHKNNSNLNNNPLNIPYMKEDLFQKLLMALDEKKSKKNNNITVKSQNKRTGGTQNHNRTRIKKKK